MIVRWNSQNYIKKAKEKLVSENCQIKVNCEIHLVSTSPKGCVVLCEDGSKEMYDGCIMAVNASDALRILGDEATSDKGRILGAFQYVYSDIYLQSASRQKFNAPKSSSMSACNILGYSNNNVCVTYWINILKNIEEMNVPFFVTVNLNQTPKTTLLKWSTGHLVPTVAASKASHELHHIQGKRKIWFSGEYQGYGYCGDGLKVMTNADLGLADAYIDGDFSFVDKDKGLLNFILILIANRDSSAAHSKNRGWWTPVFFTAGLASAKFFIKHLMIENMKFLTLDANGAVSQLKL
ncbi:uncharacterized protein [Cicer arietinum]